MLASFHLVNNFLHTAVSCAVYFLAKKILDQTVLFRYEASLMAALLFSAHTVHAEAITGKSFYLYDCLLAPVSLFGDSLKYLLLNLNL